MAPTVEMTRPVPTPDLGAIAEQTQAAALRLLKLPALNRLRRELRALKAAAQEDTMRRALGRAIRRASVEKRLRRGEAALPDTPEAAKVEARRAVDAEKDRIMQAKLAERAGRKAARQAGKASPARTAMAAPAGTEAD